MVQTRPLFQLVFFDGSCCRTRFFMNARTQIPGVCGKNHLYPDQAWFARNNGYIIFCNYEMELPKHVSWDIWPSHDHGEDADSRFPLRKERER